MHLAGETVTGGLGQCHLLEGRGLGLPQDPEDVALGLHHGLIQLRFQLGLLFGLSPSRLVGLEKPIECMGLLDRPRQRAQTEIADRLCLQNQGLFLLHGADDRLIVLGHLGRRMNALQSQEDNLDAQAGLVGRSLHIVLEHPLGRGSAGAQETFPLLLPDINGGTRGKLRQLLVTDDLQGRVGIGVAVDIVVQIADLVVHRHIGLDQTHGQCPFVVLTLHGPAGHQHAELFFMVGGAPEQLTAFGLQRLGIDLGDIAHIEFPDSFRLIDVGPIDGPGPLQREARSQSHGLSLGLHRLTKAFQHTLFARLYDDQTTTEIEGQRTEEDQRHDRLFQEQVKPGL